MKTPTPKFVVHLLSGGMDSTVLLYKLKAEDCLIHNLLFDYGQKHSKELEFAKWHSERLNCAHTTIQIPTLMGSKLTDGKGSVVVPNRNAILLSIAVNFAASIGAESVTFAANRDDERGFPDCRDGFLKALNSAIKAAELPVEVCAPFLFESKAFIARLGADMKVPIDQTWSCYRGGDVECGECPACEKRRVALNDAHASQPQ